MPGLAPIAAVALLWLVLGAAHAVYMEIVIHRQDIRRRKKACAELDEILLEAMDNTDQTAEGRRALEDCRQAIDALRRGAWREDLDLHWFAAALRAGLFSITIGPIAWLIHPEDLDEEDE